jgi:hypothetical protein
MLMSLDGSMPMSCRAQHAGARPVSTPVDACDVAGRSCPLRGHVNTALSVLCGGRTSPILEMPSSSMMVGVCVGTRTQQQRQSLVTSVACHLRRMYSANMRRLHLRLTCVIAAAPASSRNFTCGCGAAAHALTSASAYLLKRSTTRSAIGRCCCCCCCCMRDGTGCAAPPVAPYDGALCPLPAPLPMPSDGALRGRRNVERGSREQCQQRGVRETNFYFVCSRMKRKRLN